MSYINIYQDTDIVLKKCIFRWKNIIIISLFHSKRKVYHLTLLIIHVKDSIFVFYTGTSYVNIIKQISVELDITQQKTTLSFLLFLVVNGEADMVSSMSCF